MNITEANAVNVLLDRLFCVRAGNEELPPRPTDERTYEAARLLAEKARKALSAGWSPTLIDDSEWRRNR